MIIVDAKDLIMGRFATHIAKMLLSGEEVHVVNAADAVFSGSEDVVLDKMLNAQKRGAPLQGPYFPRQSDMIVKRSIRGMLPIRTARGREAYKRLRCHVGVPVELEGKKTMTFEEANKEKLPHIKFVTVRRISQHLGGKR